MQVSVAAASHHCNASPPSVARPARCVYSFDRPKSPNRGTRPVVPSPEVHPCADRCSPPRCSGRLSSPPSPPSMPGRPRSPPSRPGRSETTSRGPAALARRPVLLRRRLLPARGPDRRRRPRRPVLPGHRRQRPDQEPGPPRHRRRQGGNHQLRQPGPDRADAQDLRPGPDRNPSLGQLLNQARGEKVEVTLAAIERRGRRHADRLDPRHGDAAAAAGQGSADGRGRPQPRDGRGAAERAS